MSTSKWISKEAFKKFATKVQEESDKASPSSNFTDKWENPKKGTADSPETYKLRLLPDKAGNFYKKMYYHMFRVRRRLEFFSLPKNIRSRSILCKLCS